MGTPLACCSTPAEDEQLVIAYYRVELAGALEERYRHTKQPHDAERQVQLCRDALRVLPMSHAYHDYATRTLGAALRTRSQEIGEKGYVDEAIRLHQDLLERFDASRYSLRPRALGELGHSYLARWSLCKNASDLSASIDCLKQATNLYAYDDPIRLQHVDQYAFALIEQYQRRGGCLGDLNLIHSLFKETSELRTLGHRDLQVSLHGLGNISGLIFENTGNLESLDDAVYYQRQTLQLRDEGHPQRGTTLYNLGHTLRLRFSRFGNVKDLDEAIQYGRTAMLSFPLGHRLHDYPLGQVASALQARFLLQGNMDDLEDSIRLKREVMALREAPHPNRIMALNDLGVSLYHRYLAYGDETDFTECVQLYREALEIQEIGHPHYSLVIFNLAEMLMSRFTSFHEMENLDEAIGLHRNWFEHGNPKHHYHSGFLHDAASALRLKFEITQQESDLDAAAQYYEDALSLRPRGHPKRHETLDQLSLLLRIRFQRSHVLEDTIRALDLQREALDLVPVGHPDRAHIICGLAQLHIIRDTPYQSLNAALEHTIEALAEPTCSAHSRVKGAIGILNEMEIYVRRGGMTDEGMERLLAIYQKATNLLPQIAFVGLNHHTRLRVLGLTENLAINGAMHALRLQQSDIAVEILEAGRAVFWSQYLRLRTQFDRLPDGLSERLKETAECLERGNNAFTEQHSQPGTIGKSTLEAATAEKRKLGQKFELLIAETRSHPGLERFLLPSSFADLSPVAENGAVVVLLANEYGGAAILIRPGGDGAEQILLPNCTVPKLTGLAKAIRDSNRGGRNAVQTQERAIKAVYKQVGVADFLAELWEKIGKPVIRTLGYPVSSWSRLLHISALIDVVQYSNRTDEVVLDSSCVQLAHSTICQSMRQASITPLCGIAYPVMSSPHTRRPWAPFSTRDAPILRG